MRQCCACSVSRRYPPRCRLSCRSFRRASAPTRQIRHQDKVGVEMSWISFGNGIVAAAFLCALVAVCLWGLRVLGRKPVAFLVMFAAFSIVATIKAQKTNGVPPNVSSPSPQSQQGGVFLTGFTRLTGFAGESNPVNPVNPVKNNLPVQTTSDDIARGWRVESVITNAAVSYAMPTNATLVGNWHAVTECRV